MLAVVYGHQVPADEDDEMLTMHYAALELNTNAMAAEHIVNLFPICQFLGLLVSISITYSAL